MRQALHIRHVAQAQGDGGGEADTAPAPHRRVLVRYRPQHRTCQGLDTNAVTDYTDLQCKCGTAAAAHPRMHADHCDMSRVGAQRAQFEHARALRASRCRCSSPSRSLMHCSVAATADLAEGLARRMSSCAALVGLEKYPAWTQTIFT